MTEREVKKTCFKEISPIDVYKLLPKTNCQKCGENNCLAFAAKVVNREIPLEKCPPLLEEEKYKANYEKLWEMLKPPVKTITVGGEEYSIDLGGEFVMYRHEFTYINPTRIAIDVTDEMAKEELLERVKRIQGFKYEYIGQRLTLDMVAIRSTSNQPEKFAATVEEVLKNTDMPLILCSFNPEVMEAGLKVALGKRPLIYAATKENWMDMARLSLTYNAPLAVFAPNDLKLLRSLVKTLREYGLDDLVLDPGTIPDEGFNDTLNNLTMIRRLACKMNDELFGFPLMGVPMVVWANHEEDPDGTRWKEAYMASMLITRFTSLIIMHSLEGWALLPLVILIQNLYTDPRKPVSVEPGLRVIGNPDENSPVMYTSNFALTYYTVASDIEAAKIDCYLIVVDTEGLSVESAVAGRHLTADKIRDAIKEVGIEEKVKHRKLISPGRASRLSGETEDATGWKVLVGPLDSSGIPKFLHEKWYRSE